MRLALVLPSVPLAAWTPGPAPAPASQPSMDASGSRATMRPAIGERVAFSFRKPLH